MARSAAAYRRPARPDKTLGRGDRDWLLDMAFRCHAADHARTLRPYRRLRDILTFVRAHDGNGLNYLSGHYYADLATWYLLAWSGESLAPQRQAIPQLMAKGDGFTLADRGPCCRTGRGGRRPDPPLPALGRQRPGRTVLHPGTHPLAPLLIDFQRAREAWPDRRCPPPGISGRLRSRV